MPYNDISFMDFLFVSFFMDGHLVDVALKAFKKSGGFRFTGVMPSSRFDFTFDLSCPSGYIFPGFERLVLLGISFPSSDGLPLVGTALSTVATNHSCHFSVIRV
ncbi:MAG: hypothetical protein BMS9Abin18_1372 [Zetaproteobacteria bacterium]|nr:MAG: hypothetical protein BMS9Abin18_1372 [Zetaproteobacteria bacterium]